MREQADPNYYETIISVVVPVYNAEKNIKQCIESILAQTYRQFELILVDDGSTDRSLEICRQHSREDTRVRVYHQDNSGVGATRNAGIKMAKGRYLMFVDSDDYLDPDMLSDGVEHMKSGCELFISGTLMEYFKDNTIEKTVEYRGKEKEYTTKELLEAFDQDYPLLCIGGPCSKLFLTSILQDTKCYFDTEMTVSEDGLFCQDYISRISKVSFSDKCFYHYRRGNDESLWSRYTPALYEYQRKTYGRMRNLMSEMMCSEDSLARFEELYFDVMIGCIHNEYRNKERSIQRETEIVKKIANDEYVEKYIESGHITKRSRIVLASMIRHRRYLMIVMMFGLWNKWKKIRR